MFIVAFTGYMDLAICHDEIEVLHLMTGRISPLGLVWIKVSQCLVHGRA